MVTRVRIVFTAENGHEFLVPHATVWNPVPALDAVVKAALASAGAERATVVREMSTRVTTGVVSEPPLSPSVLRHGAKAALSLDFGEDLHALLPDALVVVGSLMNLFPSYRWETDGGAAALVVAVDAAAAPSTATGAFGPGRDAVGALNVFADGRLGADGRPAPLEHRVPEVAGAFAVDGVRYSRALAAVAGVPLREGDTVRDRAGVLWTFRGGILADRPVVVVDAATVRMVDGDRLVARYARRAARNPPEWLRPGEPCVLVLRWSDGSGDARLRAEPYADGADWGWKIRIPEPTVTHPLAMCLGTHGVAMDRSRAEECVRDGGTWDRPCEEDDECPFYDARRARGGCGAGFCEMPVGVDRASFRAPADLSTMMSHGCEPGSPDYPWCRTRASRRDGRFART